MYSLKYSRRFKKDFRHWVKRPDFKLNELETLLDKLINNKSLEEKNQNHKLTGEFKNCFECHLKPDLLLIYKIDQQNKLIYLLRIGSHSDLF